MNRVLMIFTKKEDLLNVMFVIRDLILKLKVKQFFEEGSFAKRLLSEKCLSKHPEDEVCEHQKLPTAKIPKINLINILWNAFYNFILVFITLTERFSTKIRYTVANSLKCCLRRQSEEKNSRRGILISRCRL